MILEKIFSVVTATRLFRWVSKRFISKFTFRWFGYPKFPLERWVEVLDAMIEYKKKNPLAMFMGVCSDTLSLPAILIRWITGKRDYTHAFLIYPSIHEVSQMTADGFSMEPIIETMSKSDNFAIVAVNFNSESDRDSWKDFMLGIIANPPGYDFEFKLGGSLFFCSDLNYTLGPYIREELRTSSEHGRVTYTPQDVRDTGECIWEFRID